MTLDPLLLEIARAMARADAREAAIRDGLVLGTDHPVKAEHKGEGARAATETTKRKRNEELTVRWTYIGEQEVSK